MIPIGTYMAAGQSQSLNAARLINMYPEIPVPDSKSAVVLRSSPGLSTFATIGTGPVRGMHVMAAVLFIVTGNDLYSVDSAGTGTLRGSAGTIAGTGRVSMTSNQAGELVVTNSTGTGWIWNGTTLSQISAGDADFTNDATNVTFLDQYILYGKQGTGQVYASDLNDATSWNALSFASAEAQDDDVVEVLASNGLLWVHGTDMTEVWYNAGTTPFAFARIGGAVFSMGGTLHTAASLDQSIYWLGSDNIVYRATGLQPVRISTHEIEDRISGWTNHYGFAWKEKGHAFYLLGADEGCVVFDAATNLWHERLTYDLSRWRGNAYARAYSKNLVGVHVIGRIYEMSLTNYADGAAPLQRRVITPPIDLDGHRVSMSQGQVHFEMGRGLTTGQGSDPQVIMDYSDDGGENFGNQRWGSIGKIGEYRKRAIWRRLGSFRERNFRFTYTDPTPYTIYGVRFG